MSRGRIILVVDDDPIIVKTMRAVLARHADTILTAENGQRGLEIIHREPVDCVLLDYDMPGLSGLDVLRVIRENWSPLELPVILVTGRTEPADMVDALAQGANDYVTKPFHAGVLTARVIAQLRLSETSQPKVRLKRDAAKTMDELRPGSIIAERYLLKEVIGVGGFGRVFRAEQLSTRQIVAIKCLSEQRFFLTQSQFDIELFDVELNILAQLSHPHIVNLIDSGRLSGGDRYIVLEFLDGVPLDVLIRAVGPMPRGLVFVLMRQVLDGLVAAHERGIIHSDVKPGNVMVTASGALPHAKMLDFGISRSRTKSSDETVSDRPPTIVGTVPYIAPEVFDTGEYEHRSDLFCWGLMFVECLLGEQPIQEKSMIALGARYLSQPGSVLPAPFDSLELNQFFDKLLASEPDHRFTHGAEVLSALDVLSQALGVDGTGGQHLAMIQAQIDHFAQHRHAQQVESGPTAYQSFEPRKPPGHH